MRTHRLITQNTAFKFLICTCICMSIMSCKTSSTISTQDPRETAIQMVIDDCLKKCVLWRTNKARLYIQQKGDVLRISVTPYNECPNKFLYDWLQRDLNKITKVSPTRYVVKNGKLFYWNDPDVPLSEDVIKMLIKYKLVFKGNPEDYAYIICDIKHKTYYFCLTDLSQKKVTRSWSFEDCLQCP